MYMFYECNSNEVTLQEEYYGQYNFKLSAIICILHLTDVKYSNRIVQAQIVIFSESEFFFQWQSHRNKYACVK